MQQVRLYSAKRSLHKIMFPLGNDCYRVSSYTRSLYLAGSDEETALITQGDDWYPYSMVPTLPTQRRTSAVYGGWVCVGR